MKPARLLAALILALAWSGALPAGAQTSRAEEQDTRVIASLRANGADVTKVHEIDFFLVFDREGNAAVAAERLRTLGYDIVRVNKTGSAPHWELHAKRKMVPELVSMQATTRALQALAAELDGYYDGWGTVGVK